MADITVQFSDGTSHIYKNAPDSATQDDVIARAAKDFAGKEVTNLQRSLKKQKVDASQIPVEPGANTTPTVEPEQSLADIIRGIVETPVAVAANLATGPITYLSGAGGPEFQQQVARNIQYQPRTQMAQDVLTGIGRGFETSKIPPFMPGTMQFQPLVSDVAMQARAVGATQATTAPVKINDVINAIRTQEQKPTMVGMGAAETGKALERQTRAQSLRVPVDLTKGQATREPGTQRFETETAKTYPETVGAPLLQRQIDTNQKILSNFDNYTSATGAEMSGLLRPVGQIVDAALVKQAKEAMGKVDSAYKAARASGETKQIVDTAKLEQWLADNAPESISVPQIQTIAAKLDALKKATNNQISIDDLENIYKVAGSLSGDNKSAATFMKEVKGVINSMTEGAGGDLYKKARQMRVQYARQFENASAVDKLLRKKPGTDDRAVAFEDVFQHSILNGSFDDTRNIAVLLKKGGEQGQQAWKELQGQTLNYIQEQATKNIQRDANGRPIPSAAAMNNVIRNLDADGKLDYIFGKKGAEEIRNLRDVIMDVYSPVQGTVNYSNTTSTLINALQNINKTPLSRVPGVGAATKYVEESAKQKALKKMVDESLKYQP